MNWRLSVSSCRAAAAELIVGREYCSFRHLHAELGSYPVDDLHATSLQQFRS